MSFLLLHLDVISIVSTESALWMLMVWYCSTRALTATTLMIHTVVCYQDMRIVYIELKTLHTPLAQTGSVFVDADGLVFRPQGTRDNSAEPRDIVLPMVSFLNSWLLTHIYLHLDNRSIVTLSQLRLVSTSDLKCADISDYTCVTVPAYNSCIHWVASELYECWWTWVSACGQAASAVVSGPEVNHQVYLSGLYWDRSANSYLMPLGYTEYQVICFLNTDWYPLSPWMLVLDSTLLTTHVIRLWVCTVDADGLSLGIRASATTVRTGTKLRR